MTAKLSISVPDDVADWLGRQDNVSGAVTEVIRAHMHAVRTDEVLRHAGFDVTAAGKRRWRTRLDQPIPPAARVRAREMLGRRPDADE